MNTKDFVVLPWGKSGNSVKLKYKSSGYHWKSGKVVSLSNQSRMISQNKGTAIKLSPGKVKLELLKQQLQEPVKQPLHYKMASFSRTGKPKLKGKVCGQCEDKTALLVCLECGEDYCSGCFAKIHQKGALKLHRTTLLQARSQVLSRVLDVAHEFIKEVNPDEAKGGNNSMKETSVTQHVTEVLTPKGSHSEVEITTTERAECAAPGDRLLHEGSFDEEASAQSFQEALSQWRTGSYENQEKQNLCSAKPDSSEECEVQTNLKIWREPLNIEFKEDSLSYMEKLWLKKHRRTPQEQPLSLLPDTCMHACESSTEAQCFQNTNDEDSDVEETKIQYPTFFLPVEELNIVRSEPSIKIIELDDTNEEEFEEPGSLVPYKVELANADSQLRHTFHDYQKNSFPCEKDSYQYHIFNKVKTDLSKLGLPQNSTYYKDNVKEGASNADFENIVDPDSYSPDMDKIGESGTFERKLREKSINIGSNQKFDDSNILPGSNDFLSTIDKSFFEEKLSQENKESLEFSNVYEKPDFEDSTARESRLLLQVIAIRNKHISQQYQGLERLFTFDTNERHNFLPSHSLQYSYSSTRIALSGDREWIPDSSLSAHAADTAALQPLQRAQHTSPRAEQQKGQKLQRPSTANLPLSSTIKKSSNCLSSSHPRSRSAAARPLPRAASEISESECIDTTRQNVPFLDNIAYQPSLDSSEKESNMLRNLEVNAILFIADNDPSEKLYNLTSEELPAFNNHSLKRSQISSDVFYPSNVRGPCGVEELSSSGEDTKMQSSLSLSENHTDEEKEDFLDKQLVITAS
ncbi:Zinc finger B-box domain-containing protein 1 [Fukomys damarensis]|uniref:Zinc finger B-box domain-containing protein 1 n=1 Tax=Fukomys damarensis TaxID=885580 RepID=A0A091CXC0_FUKDA|nr:Zinc finger B-box domain-containing protein 1 [Fukomys damarensis]